MSIPTDTLVDALKAAGEPTRMRILALLRRGDLAVGELVQILEQSQPRLSHHLKTLATSGLVERLPEGSWVFYRSRSKAWAGRILNALFDEIDLSSEPYQSDALALQTVRRDRASSAEAYFSEIAEDWDSLRALYYPEDAIEQAILDQVAGQSFERVIDLGTGTGRMLSLLASQAQEAEGLPRSDGEVDAVDGDEVTEALDESARFDDAGDGGVHCAKGNEYFAQVAVSQQPVVILAPFALLCSNCGPRPCGP